MAVLFNCNQGIQKMKNKLLILCSTGVLIYPNITNAGPCATTFPNIKCKTWDSTYESQKVCACTQCPDGYTLTEETDISGDYHLYNKCTLFCLCGHNTDTLNRCGSCTSTESGGPNYSTCTRCSTSGSGASLCDATYNPCHTQSVTIKGQIYCALQAGTTCTITGATQAKLFSPYCKDYYGTGQNSVCRVVMCGTNMVANTDKTECLCKIGYYGTSTTGCAECPKLGTVPAITSQIGTTDITKCFIPAGISITDNTGTYKFTNSCYYTK